MPKKQGVVCIVDDDVILCRSLKILLEEEHFVVHTFPNGEEAIAYIENNECDVIVLDLVMPGIGGDVFLQRIKSLHPDIEVIMQSGQGSIEHAVRAIQLGAYDFVTKPTDSDLLTKLIRRALDMRKLAIENKSLRSRVNYFERFNKIVGKSKSFTEMLSVVEQVAPTNATVLLSGENGTGKEVVAKLLCDLSARKDSPFVKVNCSALSESLLESELFGYEKGAFTGAYQQHKGRFEIADKGTLFLDEIGDLTPSVQVKLLRFLQEREFERVGSSKTIKSDVRIIAATNCNLKDAIEKGTFREDLYYRLRVIEIEIPSLRNRRQDIPLFVNYFISVHAENNKKSIPGITTDALQKLMSYPWPGNVRELENCIERAVILSASGEPLSLSSFNLFLSENGDTEGKPNGITNHMLIPFSLTLEEIERLVCHKFINHYRTNKEAAQSLGLSERTLYRKLRKSSNGDRDSHRKKEKREDQSFYLFQ